MSSFGDGPPQSTCALAASDDGDITLPGNQTEGRLSCAEAGRLPFQHCISLLNHFLMLVRTRLPQAAHTLRDILARVSVEQIRFEEVMYKELQQYQPFYGSLLVLPGLSGAVPLFDLVITSPSGLKV